MSSKADTCGSSSDHGTELVRVIDLVVTGYGYRDLRPTVIAAVRSALSRSRMDPVVIIDRDNRVLDGAYVALAAHELGWVYLPAIRIDR